MKIRCGFVAIIGKANAGKSSLVNCFVKQKVSIVSPKPQTTRNNILGILNREDCQIIFVDTPGIFKISNKLDDFMQKSIKGAVLDVNAIILAVDILKGVTNEEERLIKKYKNENIPVILVLTKIDLVSSEKLFSTLSQLEPLTKYCEIVPVSSLKNKNIDTLLNLILSYLPEVKEEDRYFDKDIYTDKPIKFLVQEIVREKALYYLNNEVPHGLAAIVVGYKEEDNLCTIDVDIVCEKNSHKAIIIGKCGEMLKKIGHSARVSIQKVIQKKVVLNLFVKVKPNWKNSAEALNSFGYDINETY